MKTDTNKHDNLPSKLEKKTAKLSVMGDGSLDTVSESIAALHLAGEKQTDISFKTGVPYLVVGKRIRHPLMQRRLAVLAEIRNKSMESIQVKVGNRLAEFAPKALDITEKHFKQSESGELNFTQERSLVNDTLDRTGYPRQTSQKVQHTHNQTFDLAGIQKLTEMGKTLLTTGALAGIDFLSVGKQIRGDVIDVPSEEMSYG